MAPEIKELDTLRRVVKACAAFEEQNGSRPTDISLTERDLRAIAYECPQTSHFVDHFFAAGGDLLLYGLRVCIADKQAESIIVSRADDDA